MMFLTNIQDCFVRGDVMGIVQALNLNYIFRLIISAICGFMIGRERKNRFKEAGVRTHCIVACAAALMMVVSKYAYFDVISGELFPGADIRLDPSRVASTVVSGIGFLGAGMIFVHRQNVTGLTTAAGIWATSGIGLAIGGGMYVVGIAATVLILVIHKILHRSTKHNKTFKTKILSFNNVENLVFKDTAREYIEREGIHILDVGIVRKNGVYDIDFILEVSTDYDDTALMLEFDRDCSLKEAR